MEQRYRPAAASAARPASIDLRLGPALETLRAMPADEPFDFAFIDADKAGYPEYYEEVLRLLRPGGLAMLDNMLRGGRVIDEEVSDEGDRAVIELNEKILSDERVDMAMMGVSDGVTLVRKR